MSVTEYSFNLSKLSRDDFQNLVNAGVIEHHFTDQNVILFPVISDPIVIRNINVYRMKGLNGTRFLVWYDGEIVFVEGPSGYGFWEGEVI